MSIIHPQRLKKGDVIGIITPASPVADPARIERGVRYLESLGYRTLIGAHVGKVHGYLAGTDEERAADLNGMFANKHVRAILCVRGGYGTPRLLHHLDYALIRQNPKILCGYSDITALQCALWKKCGLVSFHGPMAGVEMASGFDPYSEELFWRSLTSRKAIGKIPLDGENISTYGKGKADGRLMGGNLSLVVALLGTRWAPSFKDALLFLEEVGEEPYRIDRMMTQLLHARVLRKSAGVLLGQFSDCVPADTSKPSLTTEVVLAEAVMHSGRPALGNLPFGHVPKKITLPFGIKARINLKQTSLEFREAAVV